MSAAFITHVGSTIMCAHGGQNSSTTSNTRVFVGGQPVLTLPDIFMITGCPVNISGSPHPCTVIKWLVPASRVFVSHKPVILQNSTGICQAADQAPQGSPIVVSTQYRVSGV